MTNNRKPNPLLVALVRLIFVFTFFAGIASLAFTMPWLVVWGPMIVLVAAWLVGLIVASVRSPK